MTGGVVVDVVVVLVEVEAVVVVVTELCAGLLDSTAGAAATTECEAAAAGVLDTRGDKRTLAGVTTATAAVAMMPAKAPLLGIRLRPASEATLEMDWTVGLLIA